MARRQIFTDTVNFVRLADILCKAGYREVPSMNTIEEHLPSNDKVFRNWFEVECEKEGFVDLLEFHFLDSCANS